MYLRDLQSRVYGLKRRLDPEIVEMEKRMERQKGLVRGIAIGSILAGITALLLSPDSGENNRKRAKEELEKTKEILEVNLSEGKKKLSQIYEDTRGVINSKKNQLKGDIHFSDYGDDMNILDDDFEDFDEPEEIGEEY